MKRIMKVLSFFVTLGEKVAGAVGKVAEAADHLIHYEDYRREKRVSRVFRVMLCVACGVLAVVFFPYRIKVEKNGDFEIRSLMLRVYRKSDPYDVSVGEGDGEFDIVGAADEDAADCQVVNTTDEA